MNFPHAANQPHTDNTSSEAGFSLVEVMVALFVFALISTGTAYTVLNVMQLDRDSRARHVAVNLAAQEIDLARDAADLITLVDVARPTQLVAGNAFHVVVKTAWVSATGTDDACGATGGTLLYKRVNVEVRWDNQRAGSSPVRADTVITPNAHLNSPDRGSILVRVVGASGAGVSGVGVSAGPSAVANGASGSALATTDIQGCAVLPNLRPGNYDVTASAANHIDSVAQSSAPAVTVPLVAGYSAGASFSYDRASTFSLNYAAPTPATVYLPRDLPTTFITADGAVIVTAVSTPGGAAATNTIRTRSATLFPFASGYQAFAGEYGSAAPAASPSPTPVGGTPVTPTLSCLSVDPAAWAPVTESGATFAGHRTDLASRPGETHASAIAMGILTVTGLPAGSTLTAVSAAAPAASGDPGCARPTTYSFGAVPDGSTIALPYGSWTLHAGSTAVPASAITLGSRGSHTGAIVTLDPRVVTP